MDVSQIKPNLTVHAKGRGTAEGVPGMHVGTVAHLEGNRWIKLKSSDALDHRHHWIPVAWVEAADERAIYLNKTPDEFSLGLMDENPALMN
jgi:hypothetical protein